MNSNPRYYGNNNSLKGADGKAKAFFANGDKFYVTHDGYLKSTSGKIATLNIDTEKLQNGNAGVGNKVLNESNNKVNTNFGLY